MVYVIYSFQYSYILYCISTYLGPLSFYNVTDEVRHGKEKAKAMRNGTESDENQLVSIPCSFDMGWQKRGKGHNSRTGHAAVMSLSTGKVFDYTTRVKTCRFCDYAKKNNKEAKVHDSRKNHTASSKAMEPDAAVAMFNNAPKQNVKYSVYTGMMIPQQRPISDKK